MLVPIAVLSLAASFSSLSIAAFVLLPGAVALFVAAATSLASARPPLLRWLASFAVGSAGAALVVYSWLALFILSPDESRCWTQARSVTCTSDIISNQEAMIASILVLASAGIILVSTRFMAERVPKETV